MTRPSHALFSLAAVVAAAFSLTTPALAGDLGDGGYRYGGRPYLSSDDEGSDRYSYRGQRDDDDDRGDDDDDARDNSANDDDDDDDGRRYANRDHRQHRDYREPPRDRGYGEPRHHKSGRCQPGWRVKQRLQADGWTRFRLASFGEGVAVIRAERRHSGRPFLLKIDGCDGRTISARPVYGRDWSGYSNTPAVRYSFKD